MHEEKRLLRDTSKRKVRAEARVKAAALNPCVPDVRALTARWRDSKGAASSAARAVLQPQVRARLETPRAHGSRVRVPRRCARALDGAAEHEPRVLWRLQVDRRLPQLHRVGHNLERLHMKNGGRDTRSRERAAARKKSCPLDRWREAGGGRDVDSANECEMGSDGSEQTIWRHAKTDHSVRFRARRQCSEPIALAQRERKDSQHVTRERRPERDGVFDNEGIRHEHGHDAAAHRDVRLERGRLHTRKSNAHPPREKGGKQGRRKLVCACVITLKARSKAHKRHVEDFVGLRTWSQILTEEGIFLTASASTALAFSGV
eukprot:5480097-Pleurochrysis_carterae.AAC.4